MIGFAVKPEEHTTVEPSQIKVNNQTQITLEGNTTAQINKGDPFKIDL